MITWQETAPNTYETKVGDKDIKIFDAAYGTWTYLLSRDGRATTGGNCRTLEEAKEEAKEEAVRAAEG